MRMTTAPWLAFLVLASTTSALTPSSFLSTVDRERLEKVFTDGLTKDDPLSVAFGIKGLTLAGKAAGIADPARLCQKLQNYLNGDNVVISTIAKTTSAATHLPNCKVQLGAVASEVVKKALESDESVVNLFYATASSLHLGQAVDSKKIHSLLLSALNKDDGVLSLGYAFTLASHLDKVDVKPVFDRIEDALVQADEIDGKILQFEGGLSTTHFVVWGAYTLAEKLGKAPPISKSQAVKLANYALTRKSVQSPKGAYHMLRTLDLLSGNKFHLPVSVTLGSSATVSQSDPKVKVRVSDLLGRSLGKMDVELESAMKVSDGTIILSKTKMTQVPGDDTLFEMDVYKANPSRGFYELTITANPKAADNRLTGNVGAILTVKALADISVEDVEFGVGDSDGSIPQKVQKPAYPAKLGKVSADQHQKLTLKFSLKDSASKEKIEAHQTFVSLANAASGAEVIFVAESNDKNDYSFELDFSKAKEFGGVSGKYRLTLIIGDATVSNPISWNFADVDVSLPTDDSTSEKSTGALPEIEHLFRQPEKRPAAIISNGFTILCLLPILLMFAGWGKLGVNLSNFPFSVTALGFHIGLGAIFTLYYFFWLNMTMFTTIKYLIMLGVVTFLCGNSMLARIADKAKA